MKDKRYFKCNNKTIHTFEHDTLYLVYLVDDSVNEIMKSELTLSVSKEEYDTFKAGDTYESNINKIKK